jgi:electron-transferring-flavoprotein dehydrogenase
MKTGGGSFLYHFGDNYVAVGFVVHLNYKNPYLSPFDEFQRFKTHPAIARTFEGGKRISYGARAITEGGYQSVPKLTFPGGALIGCSAGFVNVPRIKGSHNAVLTACWPPSRRAMAAGRANDEVIEIENGLARERVGQGPEASSATSSRCGRSSAPPLGVALGGSTCGPTPVRLLVLRHAEARQDRRGLAGTGQGQADRYPKPDGVITFDKLSSVFLSNTNHEEDQPVHLKLKDMSIPIAVRPADKYGEPARPATVRPASTRWVQRAGDRRFQINAQNCVHCKTCDIKDPSQNIVWTTPEGGGGPNYPNMSEGDGMTRFKVLLACRVGF